jgi:hypothetical protein
MAITALPGLNVMKMFRDVRIRLGMREDEEYLFLFAGYKLEDIPNITDADEVRRRADLGRAKGRLRGILRFLSTAAINPRYLNLHLQRQAVAGTRGGAKNNRGKSDKSAGHLSLILTNSYLKKAKAHQESIGGDMTTAKLRLIARKMPNPLRGYSGHGKKGLKSFASMSLFAATKLLNSAGFTNNNNNIFTKSSTLGTLYRYGVTKPFLAASGRTTGGDRYMMFVHDPAGSVNNGAWKEGPLAFKSYTEWREEGGCDLTEDLGDGEEPFLEVGENFITISDNEHLKRIGNPKQATQTLKSVASKKGQRKQQRTQEKKAAQEKKKKKKRAKH